MTQFGKQFQNTSDNKDISKFRQHLKDSNGKNTKETMQRKDITEHKARKEIKGQNIKYKSIYAVQFRFGWPFASQK